MLALYQPAMTGEYTCGRCLHALRQRAVVRLPHYALPSRGYGLFKPALVRSLSSCSKGLLFSDSPPQTASKQTAFTPPTASQSLGSVVHKASSSTNTFPDSRVLLKPNNLFHSFSQSPAAAIRQRAAFIKQNAFCPHPSHQQTRLPVSPHDPETRKSPQSSNLPPAHSHFECPDCGVPIYCSEGHWMDDFEAHLEVCETIRQINEDDHDLHSGRVFPEFTYPGLQDDNFVINMTNWDTFLYTREFEAINDDRSMRQVTRMLTYPLTLASVLHELSPYNVRKGGRLTVEGLKSVSGKSSRRFLYLVSFPHMLYEMFA